MATTFGVYVHIPFSASRCDYCDFATWTDRPHLIDDYVGACVGDIERRAAAGELPPATSVFFGGGTPSLIPADRLVRVLDAIPRADDAEVTVECNPDSIDQDKLRSYRAHGVNRISLGVQSMVTHVLGALGRTHDVDNVARAVDAARAAGIERVNVDLIYGATGESMADWSATLDGALALEPTHVSAYALTVESATPLGRRVAAGEERAPDDDDQAGKYQLADDLLSGAGLGWYEISNWAAPGEECRHNALYWDGGEYAGIGCAAHGHFHGRRYWNVASIERYVARVADDESTEAGSEALDVDASADEAMMLALRTRDGADVAAGLDGARSLVPLAGALEELAAAGTVTRPGPEPWRVVLTRDGRLLANDVTARLLAARDATRRSSDPR